jgi:membrane protease YdiL (CAAX protease family)
MALGKSLPGGASTSDVGIPTHWIVVFYGLLGAVAIAWRVLADGELPWRHPAADEPGPLVVRVSLGVGLGVALVVISRLATRTTRSGARLAAELGAVLGRVSRGRAWAYALASGLAEEAFFRGALQPQVGFLAATVLFALAHYAPRPGLRIWSVFALAAGAAFGALFLWTGDLLAPALAHIVVNGANLHWLSEWNARSAAQSRDGFDLDGGAER